MSAPAYAHRFVDYSAANCNTDKAVLKFIYGVRDRRENPVTQRSIVRYFRATPNAYIIQTIDKLVDNGLLVIQRTSPNRKRAGYVYDITEPGYHCMIGDSWWVGDKSQPMTRRFDPTGAACNHA